jgi:hypothetical protein
MNPGPFCKLTENRTLDYFAARALSAMARGLPRESNLARNYAPDYAVTMHLYLHNSSLSTLPH